MAAEGILLKISALIFGSFASLFRFIGLTASRAGHGERLGGGDWDQINVPAVCMKCCQRSRVSECAKECLAATGPRLPECLAATTDRLAWPRHGPLVTPTSLPFWEDLDNVTRAGGYYLVYVFRIIHLLCLDFPPFFLSLYSTATRLQVHLTFIESVNSCGY